VHVSVCAAVVKTSAAASVGE